MRDEPGHPQEGLEPRAAVRGLSREDDSLDVEPRARRRNPLFLHRALECPAAQLLDLARHLIGETLERLAARRGRFLAGGGRLARRSGGEKPGQRDEQQGGRRPEQAGHFCAGAGDGLTARRTDDAPSFQW